MKIKIDTTNLKILQDFFSDLSVKDQSNIWMSTIRKSAKPLIQTAQAFIPYESGTTVYNEESNRQPSYGLHRSIGVIPYKYRLGMWVGSRVSTQTVRHGKLWNVFYGRLVEWDHRKRGKGRGNGIGIVKGTHFFENAWNATKGEVCGSIGNEWVNSIDRFMGRLDKKLKKVK